MPGPGHGEEFLQPGAGLAEAAAHFGKFCQGIVRGFLVVGQFPDALDHIEEGTVQGVFHQPGGAHAVFAPGGGELRGILHGGEEGVHLIKDLGRAGDAIRAFGEGEEAFLGAGIVEAVEVEAQAGLGEIEPQLPRGGVFQGVGFVQNNKVVGEEEAFAFHAHLVL